MQCALDHHILMLADQRPVDGYLDLLAASFELPAMDIAAARKSPVDAGMAMQFVRGLWRTVTRKVGRRHEDKTS